MDNNFQLLSLCKLKRFTAKMQKRLKAPRALKKLQKALKKLSTKWAVYVIEEMNKERDTDKVKLYNILNGSIQDKEWHNIFIAAANKVIEDLKQKEETPIV